MSDVDKLMTEILGERPNVKDRALRELINARMKKGGAVVMAEGGKVQAAPYGLRETSGMPKGKGYFGELPTAGGVMTELSASDDAGDFPLIVPTLTAAELKHLQSGGEPTAEIYAKAKAWAESRKGQGRDPFATSEDLRMPVPEYAKGGEVYAKDGGDDWEKLKRLTPFYGAKPEPVDAEEQGAKRRLRELEGRVLERDYIEPQSDDLEAMVRRGLRSGLGKVMSPEGSKRSADILTDVASFVAPPMWGYESGQALGRAYEAGRSGDYGEAAMREYPLYNTLTGMASPGSEVMTEIPRGSAAYYLLKQGRFPEFEQYGGVPFAKRRADFPVDLLTVPSHPYHRTSQATPMRQFVETGEIQMDSPKVPMYIEASGVPETGFQTATPVGDAHWSRAVGLADTRGPKTLKGKQVVPGASVTNAEMAQLAPWWREKIAGEMGLESVPAQARTWGLFSPQTGVTTPIGAPKLELISDQAVLASMRLGITPEEALSLIMQGKQRYGKKEGGAITSADNGAKR